jgi:hypothetical protein
MNIMEILGQIAASGAGFALVYILPGLGLLRCLPRSSRKFPSVFLAGIALSFALLAILGYLYFIRLLRLEQVLILMIACALMGLAGLARDAYQFVRGGGRLALPRDPLRLTCLALCAVTLILLTLRERGVSGDYIFHITGIRKIAQTSVFLPFDVWGRYHFAPFLPYRYPLWHFSLALVCRLSGLDPVAASWYLPMWLCCAALAVWHGVGFSLSGSRSFAWSTAACFGLIHGLLYRCDALNRILMPQRFSDLILLPLLLSIYLTILEGRKRDPARIVLLAVLAMAQLEIHASHWMYFLLLAGALAFVYARVLKRRVDWVVLLWAAAGIALAAVPIALGYAASASGLPIRQLFEIDKRHFLKYSFSTSHGKGRIERIAGTDLLIVNRSVIFYRISMVAWLYAGLLLWRRRFSAVQLYALTAVIVVTAVQLNPAAIHFLAPLFSIPSVFRMSNIIPLPVIVASGSISLLTLARRIRFVRRPWLIALAAAAIFPAYAYVLAPFYGAQFWKLQWYVMPAAGALVMLLAGRLLYRSFRRTAPREYRPEKDFGAAHLWLLLLLLSPHLAYLAVRAPPGLPSGGPPSRDSLAKNPLMNYLSRSVPRGAVILANGKMNEILPVYVDCYSYIGWTPSSPSVERFVGDRLEIAARIVGYPQRPASDYSGFASAPDRYDLLVDQGIEYLLLSSSAPPSPPITELVDRGYISRLWENNSTSLYAVSPPPPSALSPRESRILESFETDYSESSLPAVYWQISKQRLRKNPPGVWVNYQRPVERMLLSREKLSAVGFEVHPITIPARVRLRCGGEEKDFEFSEPAPRRWLARPRSVPAWVKMISGGQYYSCGISAAAAAPGAAFVRIFTAPDQIERALSPDARGDTLPGALPSDTVPAGPWFASRGGEEMKRRADRYSRLFECEDMQSLVGSPRDDPQASAGRAMGYDPSRDRAGCLVFGPYVRLLAQPWVAIFRLKYSHLSPGEIATVDVSCARGGRILGRRIVTGGDFARADEYCDIALPFDNDRMSNEIECRVFTSGPASVTADCVSLRPDLRAWYARYSDPAITDPR